MCHQAELQKLSIFVACEMFPETELQIASLKFQLPAEHHLTGPFPSLSAAQTFAALGVKL